MTVTVVTEYKDDIVNRMGGSTHYGIIIDEFCESLMAEKSLKKFYQDFDMNSLVKFQREMLDWVFGKFESKKAKEMVENRIKLHHYRLVEDGFSHEHIDVLCQHFVNAIQDSWVDDEVVEMVQNHLQCLHILLKSMQLDQRFSRSVGAYLGQPSSVQGSQLPGERSTASPQGISELTKESASSALPTPSVADNVVAIEGKEKQRSPLRKEKNVGLFRLPGLLSSKPRTEAGTAA